MPFERVMGINVTDEVEYQKYRTAMMPILAEFGGEFGFDFRVSEVLLSKTDDEINRVFTLEFPDRKTMDAFFFDTKYLEIKKQHFDCSVNSKTIISMHEKNE
jgi:uncharacterized protein (DUF1330 family)